MEFVVQINIYLYLWPSATLSTTIREQKYWLRTIRLSRAFILEAEQKMFVGMRNIMLKWAKPPDWIFIA